MFIFNEVILVIIANCIVGTISTKCESDHFKFGQWVPGATKNCGVLDRYDQNATVLPFSDWCWKPVGCDPKKFYAQNFCNVMKNKSMLLVGDSLAHNLYETFIEELKREGEYSRPFGERDSRKYERGQGKVCNGATAIIWARNDHLTVTDENENPHAREVLNKIWKSVLPDMDVLLLSKGNYKMFFVGYCIYYFFEQGHHVTPHEISESLFIEQSLKTVEWLRDYQQKRQQDSSQKPLSIYFMETSPGQSNIQFII